MIFKDLVTCLAIDFTGTFVVSGSMDTTCMIWQVVHEYGVSINLDPTPLHILYGHTECVTSVDISNELDMVVSGSSDGTVNIHTLRAGCFVRTISFWNERITVFKNINVKLSNFRHILVYTRATLAENPNEIVSNRVNVCVFFFFFR